MNPTKHAFKASITHKPVVDKTVAEVMISHYELPFHIFKTVLDFEIWW